MTGSVLTKKIFVFCGLIFVVMISGCGMHTYHKVRPGDTLYSVSFHYGQDFRKIAQWNNVNSPYMLHVGEWLRVAPPAKGTRAPARPKSKPVARNNHKNKKYISSAPARVAPKSRVTTPLTWVWPAKGKVIKQFNAKALGKKGVQIADAAGSPIYAAADGKVAYVGHGLRGYGNLIIIKHNDKYLSAYAHNQENLIKDDQVVKRGQLIARMGDTDSDRVKLHFEVRINGKPVDPLRYLPKR